MPLVILALYIFALVVFDQQITVKRVEEYGPDIELNPIVRRAVIRWGAFPGSSIGLIVPNAVVLWVLVGFKLRMLLAFYAGFKTCWALMQLKSLDL